MSIGEEISRKINDFYHSKPSQVIYVAWDPKMNYNVTIIDYSLSKTNSKNMVNAIDNHNKVFAAHNTH